MCGICGVYNFDRSNLNLDSFRSMAAKMRHRGPDDQGFSLNHHAGIGMVRLSIIDVQGGHQPIANEDGSIEIVLNGEIYNYVELRQELMAKGHSFKSHTDTEVIVHLYEEYGPSFLTKLNGMFAFILWDKKKDSFLIVRDRLGIKPLYYFSDSKRFLCCSDLQALRKALPQEPRIKKNAFLGYLVMAYVPGTDTIYENIHKLAPGHWMQIKGKEISLGKYWDIDIHKQNQMSVQEAQEQLEGLLKDSIRLEQRSDVPIGTFLSGGIDSSLVVALLSQANTQPVRTFTVDFIGKQNNESSFARLVAKRYTSEHFEAVLDEAQMAGLLRDLTGFMDEPICDSAIIPSYFLSKKAKERGVKVLLNGTGGDELFGGYLRHHPYAQWSKYQHIHQLPQLVKKTLSASLSGLDPHKSLVFNDERLYWALTISGVDLGVLKTLLKDPKDFELAIDILKDRFSFLLSSKERPYYSKMYHDLTNYMVCDVLSLLDKTTMACSIEGRVPLLDHRLVEFAFSLPEQVNILDSKPKGLLRSVAQKYVPKEIMDRPKTGFNAPVQSMLRGSLGQQARQQLRRPNEFFTQMFDVKSLNQFSQKNQLKERASETMFSLSVFDGWYQQHHV